MQINSFMPAKIISGSGCLIKNSAIFDNFGECALIITGKQSAKLSGALEDLIDLFESKKIKFEVFDSVEPNPETLTCHNAGHFARQIGADFIVGIGGGSVMDAAKAVAIFAENPDFEHRDIYTRNIPSKKLPLILIGTTSGTGSEVTGVSVLTDSDRKLKKSISGIDCYADYSICDYCYTKSADLNTRISTALDAYSHAIESYLSSTSNDLSMLFAEKAIDIISPYILRNCFSELSDDDYEKLYIASLYAGLAINITGTCFPHTVGYCLTEMYGVPHGRACAVFFPVLFERAKKYCPERLEAILNAADCEYDMLLGCVKKLNNLTVKLTKNEICEISKRWSNGIRNFDRTPGGFSRTDAEKALYYITV